MQVKVKLREVAGVVVVSMPREVLRELRWEVGRLVTLTTSQDRQRVVVEQGREDTR